MHRKEWEPSEMNMKADKIGMEPNSKTHKKCVNATEISDAMKHSWGANQGLHDKWETIAAKEGQFEKVCVKCMSFQGCSEKDVARKQMCVSQRIPCTLLLWEKSIAVEHFLKCSMKNEASERNKIVLGKKQDWKEEGKSREQTYRDVACHALPVSSCR